MTQIYFVRHAEPNYANHDDLTRELSPKGLQDRHAVTAFLRDKGVSAVLSSPYRRALDTVRPFAEEAGLPIIHVRDFRERRITDGWIDDFNAFARRQWADFDYALPGGESLRQVQRRCVAALERVLEEYAGECVVIGGHGTAISTVLNYYRPAFGYEAFEQIRHVMPWIVRLDFDGMQLTEMESIFIHRHIIR